MQWSLKFRVIFLGSRGGGGCNGHFSRECFRCSSACGGEIPSCSPCRKSASSKLFQIKIIIIDFLKALESKVLGKSKGSSHQLQHLGCGSAAFFLQLGAREAPSISTYLTYIVDHSLLPLLIACLFCRNYFISWSFYA